MLEEDMVVLSDQQAGDRIARYVVDGRKAASLKIVVDLCCRALEIPGRPGALDEPCRIDLIEMGERADTVFCRPGVAPPSRFHNNVGRAGLHCTVTRGGRPGLRVRCDRSR